MCVWDVSTGALRRSLHTPHSSFTTPHSPLHTPHSPFPIHPTTPVCPRCVCVWDVSTGALRQRVEGVHASHTALCWTHNTPDVFATAATDTECKIFDMRTKKVRCALACCSLLQGRFSLFLLSRIGREQNRILHYKQSVFLDFLFFSCFHANFSLIFFY